MDLRSKIIHYFPVALLGLICIWNAAGLYDEDSLRQLNVREAIYPFNLSYQCNRAGIPNPSPEYPVILFKDMNFNNCSGSGYYIKLRKGQFHKFSANIEGGGRGKNMQFKSMLMMSGMNVSFRACCPSGMQFHKTLSDWQSTPDMNHSVFFKADLGSTSGIFYSGWLYWDVTFYIKADAEQNIVSNATCPQTCYFGECGDAGKCECAPGYSGTRCEIRPTNASFPTQQKPLVLFTNKDFEGTFVTVSPDSFQLFARNERNTRTFLYRSARVLYNRTITFSRNIVFPTTLTLGGDIEDLEDFMIANQEIGDGLWINYDNGIELEFSMKVAGNPQCDNCTVNGYCYTGTCQCFTGFTGVNCETTI